MQDAGVNRYCPLQTEALANETFIEADLGDYAAVKSVMEGAEIVVHFGGHPDEKPFDEILHANIIGCYNVWDTAYHAGAPDCLCQLDTCGWYASKDKAINSRSQHRPDSYYGLANACRRYG